MLGIVKLFNTENIFRAVTLFRTEKETGKMFWVRKIFQVKEGES
jgi:hypothetical protein